MASKTEKAHHYYQCSKCGRRIPYGEERMVETKKKGNYAFVCKAGCES